LSAGAPPQTPLGKLTDFLAGFYGPTAKGGEERKRERRGEEPLLARYTPNHQPMDNDAGGYESCVMAGKTVC